MREVLGERDGGPPSGFDVSFVVTVFNKAGFISGMVDSLRSQHAELRQEYIFVDDGSTDGSADRLAEASADLPNVTIVRQANQGPAIATNTGVRSARGRYVKLLDGDDRLVPGITSRLYARMDELGLDLLVGGLGHYRLGFETPSDAVEPGNVRLLDDPLETVIATGLSNTSGTIFSRESFLAAGGCDETVFVQDFSFFARMARSGRFGVTDTVVALVPVEAGGRVSGITGQALHDTNRTLLNLAVSDRPLPARYLRLAMRRAAGRAWKWARRHRGATPFSSSFWVNVVSRIPLARLAPWVLRQSCRPFYADPNLRFPGARV